MLSSGATIISAQTTFCSAMIDLFMILALRAANSQFVLCRTLRCGLPANMVLQKKPTRFANNNPKEIFLLVHKKIRHYNGSKMDFSKNYKHEISQYSPPKQIVLTQQIS
jgi:hypothetical protein